ncbi:MAG: acetoacetate decarboxylase family protein [Alcanivoracaceae bacterium]
MIAEAPWRLRGRAYICALELPDTQRQQQAGTPEALGQPGGRRSLVMYVDYSHSDVGPYHELLFIPGHFPFADGHRHPSIGRIYVSSQDSVDSGRHNWGIPKQRADFSIERGKRRDNITVTTGGDAIARLSLRHGRLALPAPGMLLPPRYRTIGQLQDNQHFLYAPASIGLMHRATVESVWGDGDNFPAIQHGDITGAAYLSRFYMRFPVARRLPATA